MITTSVYVFSKCCSFAVAFNVLLAELTFLVSVSSLSFNHRFRHIPIQRRFYQFIATIQLAVVVILLCININLISFTLHLVNSHPPSLLLSHHHHHQYIAALEASGRRLWRGGSGGQRSTKTKELWAFR